MKSRHIYLFICLMMAFSAVNAYAQEDTAGLEERVKALEDELHKKKGFDVYWKNGLRMETSDRAFRIKIGGRLQNDWAFFSESDEIEDAVDDFEDGTEMRRARFFLSGTIYENIEFKIQYDFADGEAEAKDVYIGFLDVPVLGTVRIGHQREPLSRVQGSSKYTTFLEKGLQNAFSPGRNTGLRVLNNAFEGRLTWSAGIFREADSFAHSTSGDAHNVTARISGLPVYKEKEGNLLHLAGAVSFKHLDEEGISFSERPESHLAPKLVDTDDISADAATIFATEAAIILGPLSFEGEYIHTSVDVEDGNDLEFGGYHVTASIFLTGETRPFDTSEGKFSRLKPKNNLSVSKGGIGAWEIAARYSGIDLNDEDVMGGMLNDITVALNWYPNPNTRIMFNYIFSDLDDVGDAQIFQMRFQLDI